MPLAELTVAPRYGALPLAAARLALRSVLPMQATGAAMNDRTNDHTKLMKLIALAGSDNDAEAIASFRKATHILARNGISWTGTSIPDHLKELLALAASEAASDAEAIAALHHATRILARNGKSWTDIAISFSDAMKKRAGKSAGKR